MTAISATDTGLPALKKRCDAVQSDAIVLAGVLEGIEALLQDRTAANAVSAMVQVAQNLANKIADDLDSTNLPGVKA